MQGGGVKTVGTLDYVVVMIGLFFIVESLSDAFKSRRMCDCEDEKKMREIEERVKRLEEGLHEQKV